MPRSASSQPQTPVWSDPSLRDGQFSRSLEKGLAILACFTPEQPARGNSDVASELAMSPSTTHRYLTTLWALGYLDKEDGHTYRPGLRVADLGLSALNATGLRGHAHPLLEELRRRSSHTVSLAVLDGTEIRYLDRVPSFRRGQAEVDLGLRPGSTLPAYCTAMGKLLLAHLPKDEQRERITEMAKLVKRGPNTITTKRALRSDLEQAQGARIAVSDEELAPGLCEISAPVRNESWEVVAAAGMATQTSLISAEELVKQLSPHLISTADVISARLGYRRDDEITRAH